MAYEVTATRRRPAQFKDLAGQEFVVSTIQNSIKAGRIAHAYLFSGPRGVGKTSAARILARALNCESGPAPVSCGKCSACIEIAGGNALDVIEIDGASNTSVNDIRQIKDEVLFSPNSCRYKIYIIDEVHMLSTSAFNALLKTIEEPPPYVIFIFATTEIHKVPATIRSRCQQFNFRLLSLEKIKENLREACLELEIDAEDEALFWIAKEGTGSMRDAYTLFDQVAAFSENFISIEKIRKKLGLVGLDSINTIVESMVSRNASMVIELCSEIIASGVSIEQFAIDLAEYFRSLLFIKCGIEKESLLGYARARYSMSNTTAFSKAQIEKALDIIFSFYREIRYSINPRFELELLLSRLSDLSAWLSPVDVYDKLEKLKADFASGISLPLQEESSEKENEVSNKPEIKDEIPEQIPPEESESAKDVISAESDGEIPEITSEQWQTILDEIRKGKITLAASVEQSTGWTIEKDKLTFKFKNGYTANVVKNEKKIIQEIIKEITGTIFMIEVKVERHDKNSDTENSSINKQIDMVKNVFRGEVINGDN